MNIETLIAAGIAFFQNYPIPAVAIVVVIAVIAFIKPKEIFKLLLVGLAIGVILYIVSFMVDSTSIGIEQKNTLIQKSDEYIE